MPPVGFETAILASERALDPRLRPRGHWDRRNIEFWYLTINLLCVNKVANTAICSHVLQDFTLCVSELLVTIIESC
jgi:hypothetical protein